MKLEPKVKAALEDAIEAVGEGSVLERLLELKESAREDYLTLTIVTNAGIHHLPEEYARGEVFIASHGSLDFSTSEKIHKEFRCVLMKVARKLKEKGWRKVYIVPFGPTTLAMQIKLLVFRVCAIESIEVMHMPNGPRVDVEIDIRSLILESNEALEYSPS